MAYKWNIKSNSTNTKDVLITIMKEKGMNKDEIKDFINCSIKPRDPFLLTNMDKAVNRLKLAKDKKEKLFIVGDYDCDGVTSIVVLYIGLRHLGYDVIWEVPDRFKDGYGLNNRLIDVANDNDCNLIITADNGIASHEQVKYANSLGIEVIVTDHHELLKDSLPTDITIDPKIDDCYPFKGICGCMVAFKLLNALHNFKELDKEIYEELLCFVCIGTIADVMELLDENRYYVSKGLKLIRETKNIGLMELLKAMKLDNQEITSTNIAFSIGPAINAAGRLKTPKMAIDLFLADDLVTCEKLAKNLVDLNDERKRIQKEVADSIVVEDSDNFIIVTAEVSHGVIGIIAGKLSEKYQRPCFVLNKHKGKLSGSGRSILDYDISDIIVKNDFVSGGGHSAACGLQIEEEDLDKLKDVCSKHFLAWKETKGELDLTPSIDIISKINLNIIDHKLINSINRLQPFGEANLEPLFVSENVRVGKYKIVGKTLNTIQFVLDDETNILNGIAFNATKDLYEELGSPDYIDIAYSLSINEFRGQKNIQLMIKDIKISEKNTYTI